jgi:phosphoglycolate phosphatase-like HAD superfamily hydrolase
MPTLVFLDFDGVICDSALECLVSSWEAYFRDHGRDAPKAVPVDLKERFLALRPYVRSGEDFMLCQQILHEGPAVASQEDFDRLASSNGPTALSHLRETFYTARARLLKEERTHWIRLNRLYPWVAARLPRWAASPCAYILSTKRPQYIDEILRASGIAFPTSRILFSEKDKKGARIEELLERRGRKGAVIVDDQIDHLAAIRRSSARISVYLAAWGYVKPEWLIDCPIPVLQMDEIGTVLEPLLAPCGP